MKNIILHSVKNRVKVTILFGVFVASAFLLWVGHSVVVGQEDRHIYIFPTSVDSRGWENPSAAYTQNLSGQAMFDEFDESNSSYIVIGEPFVEEVTDDNSTTQDTVEETTEEQPTEEEETTQDSEETSTDEGTTEEQQGEEEAVDENESTDETQSTEEQPAEEESSDTTQEDEDTETQPVEEQTDTDEQAQQDEVAEDEQTGESEGEPLTVINVIEKIFRQGVRVFSAPQNVFAQEEEAVVDPAQEESEEENNPEDDNSTTQDTVEETTEEQPTEEEETTQDSEETSTDEGTTEEQQGEEEAVDENESTDETQSTEEQPAEEESSDTTQEDEDTETQPVEEQTDTDEQAQQDEVAEDEQTGESEGDEENSETVEESGEEDTAGTATPTEDAVSEEVVDEVVEEEVETVPPYTCEILDKTCYTMNFSGFGIGEPAEGEKIKESHIVLSFASLMDGKEFSDDRLFVKYLYEGEWKLAGEIELNNEVSNVYNGGHFRFKVVDVKKWNELANLEVILEYDRNEDSPAQIYLDSLWLDVTYTGEGDFENENALSELALDAEVSPDILVTPEGERVDFVYTDENSNETLIIKTDEKIYEGLTKSTVYFNVTNISDQEDEFSLSVHLPESKGSVSSLKKWMHNVPYNVIKPQYADMAYYCASGWEVETIENLDGGFDERSTCIETSEVRYCSEHNDEGTNCIVEGQRIATKMEVVYRDNFTKLGLQEGEFEHEKGLLKKTVELFGGGIDRKPTPADFVVKSSTDDTHLIAPGQTIYFQMEIEYPLDSSGEFYIEAIGSDGTYGMLDPWWNGGWLYRLPITIDNTNNPSALSDFQMYIHIGTTTTSFWQNVDSTARDVRFVQEEDVTGDWYDNQWEYRSQITIQSSQVDAALSNFPVYVNLADLGSTFFSNVRSDGGDIRVTTNDKLTEVPREVVNINTSNGTGEMYFRASSLSSTTDSVFYIYYGNGGAADHASTTSYGAQNVWDDNYVLVSHMDDLTTSFTENSASSTLNGAKVSSGNPAESSTAKFGNSQDFSSDTISHGDLGIGNSHTTEVWINPDTLSGSGDQGTFGFTVLASAPGSGGTYAPWFTVGGSGGNVDEVRYCAYSNSSTCPASSGAGLVAGNWYYIAATAVYNSEIHVDVNNVEEINTTAGTTAFGNTFTLGDLRPTRDIYFDGKFDELRMSDIVRSDEWLSTTYRNMSTSTDFYATTTAQQYVPPVANELDFWITHWDHTGSTSDVWVQIDDIGAATTTEIWLYYGNSSAGTSSDQYLPFTYDTMQELYYVVDSDLTGATLDIVSLIDGNVIQIGDGATTSLDRQEATSTTAFTATTSIKVLGPIQGKINGMEAAEAILPVSFASTTFAVPSSRSTERFYVYSPFASSSVQIYNGGAASASDNFSVATGSAYMSSIAVGSTGIVEASEPILLAFDTSNPGDAMAMYPVTTEPLFGVKSNANQYIGPVQDSTAFDISCSSGTGLDASGIARGTQFNNNNTAECTSSNQGAGAAVHIFDINNPVAAIHQADGDGNESGIFLPRKELSSEYMIATDGAYFSIACPAENGEVNIAVYDETNTYQEGGTCTPSGTSTPGKLRFGDAVGDTQSYDANTRVVSIDNIEKPFYIYYEDWEATDNDGDDGDENNLWGAVQARKYAWPVPTYSIGTQEVSTEPQYTQTSYRWYANTDAIVPTDPWPEGGEDLLEDEEIGGVDAVGDAAVIRLRMNILVGNATSTAGADTFKLQYAEGETCSSGLSWYDVGSMISGSIWRGYNNASVSDGATLSTSTLSTTDVLETYEEENNTASTPNQVGIGERAEWDWVIQNNSAPTNSSYCFRMVNSNGQTLFNYTSYPQLVTNSAPNEPSLITLFDNEKTADLTPAFTFTTTDDAADELDYQIQVDDDFGFGSPVIDQSTLTQPEAFENVTNPSDKAPYLSGSIVQYTVQSNLSDGTTYYWRVRAKDTQGSDEWGDWATPPSSFTTDTAVTVSTWFQTTQEQFNTNNLLGTTASTSDSVIDGGTVGEFGAVEADGSNWQTVTLDREYKELVVVASVRYDGDTQVQRSPRIKGKTTNSFQIKADNHASSTAVTGLTTIDWLAMEAGSWTLDDGGTGLQVEAGTESVAGNFGNGCTSGSPTVITFSPAFSTAPAVLHTVTSDEDTDWVASKADDSVTSGTPPTTTTLGLRLMTSFAPCTHGEESIDYVAFETGHGTTTQGVVFDVVIGTGTFDGTSEGTTPVATPFTEAFASAPLTYISGQMGENGGNGSWSLTDTETAVTATNYYGAVDEDGPSADRSHALEDGGVIAFATATGTIEARFNGRMVSTPIDFNDGTVGNIWGEFSWNDLQTSGTTTYQVEYKSGSSWIVIPDTVLSGNETGFTTGPISLTGLDTETYNEIRLVAEFESTGTSPILYDWTVEWKETVAKPTVELPFDNEKVSTTTPSFEFYSTDPEGQGIEYEFSISTSTSFTSSTTKISGTDSGFINTASTTNASPFVSGDTIQFTLQGADALTEGETYWWKVRARDPDGDNTWSFWSDMQSITVDTSIVVSTWFQTTQEQFDTDSLVGVQAMASDDVRIQTDIGEYGTTTVTTGVWQTINLDNVYTNPIVTASVRYDQSVDSPQSPRVRNKTSTSFDVMVSNIDTQGEGTTHLLGGASTTVDWVVMEEGSWIMDDGSTGIKVEAGTQEDVSGMGYNGNYDSVLTAGDVITFGTAFDAAPVVFATVSTNNDSNWIWAGVGSPTDHNDEPISTGMGVYLQRGFADSNHLTEDIDYIAIDPGHGTNNGVEFEATNFTRDGSMVDNGPDSVSFTTTFTTAPAVHVVGALGMVGGNGGFMLADTSGGTPASTASISLAMEEDGPDIGSRGHTQESAGIFSFATSSGSIKRAGGALSGTIDSTPIDFDDGNGPKWGEFSWTDTETGTSTLTYQVYYLNASSTYELIPDVDLPGNSTGTSTSPIDLGTLNYQTYNTLKVRGNFTCSGSGDCPILSDWVVNWSEGIVVSGTIKEYDGVTNVATGTVALVVNGVLSSKRTGTINNGVWSISNVTAFPGDTVTVFVDGAVDADKAVGVAEYNSIGDMTGFELFEHYLSIGSDDNQTITNADLAMYDADHDTDLIHNVTGNNLAACDSGGCTDVKMYIKSGNTYRPDSAGDDTVETHDMVIHGTVIADSNTFNVSGSWLNDSIFQADTSSVVFDATSGTETVDSTGAATSSFNNVIFGQGSGSATWVASSTVDADGNINVTYGTLDMSNDYDIFVGGYFSIAANGGFTKGAGTTTFDGTGMYSLSDYTAVKQDIGNVVIDGTNETVILGSDIKVTNLVIGGDDTLDVTVAPYNIEVGGSWTNNNIFTARSGEVVFTSTTTGVPITTGVSSFYDLTFNGIGGGWDFQDVNIGVGSDLTITNGEVNMPTGVTTIGGSFVNNDTFSHPIGTIQFTSTSGGEVVTLGGDSIFNVNFNGVTGAWTMTDAYATTTNDFDISLGTVTLPSGTLEIGGSFDNTGGTFVHNSGNVLFNAIIAGETIRANGSSFNDISFIGGGAGTNWYNVNWTKRTAITVQSSQIDNDLSDFPVYVNLADLGSDFWGNVQSDGGDIRITNSDGKTELPREIVNINTSTGEGELHFKAGSLASTTNSTFYIYYGNDAASGYADTDTYGTHNVWDSDYVLVTHMDDLTTSSVENSKSASYDGTKGGVNTPNETTTGKIAEAQEFSTGGVDDISHGNFGSLGQFTMEAWINPDTISGSGDYGSYGFTIMASAAGGQGYTWLAVQGSEIRFWAYESDAAGGYHDTTGAGITTDEWFHVVATAVDASSSKVYVNGEEKLEFVNDSDSNWTSIFTIGDLRPERDINFDGEIDEVRVSSAVRTQDWVSATYNNHSTTTDFYATTTEEMFSNWKFLDSNATAVGDMTVDGGTVLMPSGVFSLGGSLLCTSGLFESNNGTFNFNSDDTGETVDPGSSSFYDAVFDHVSGGWTITGDATSTNDWDLLNAASFDTGAVHIEVQGEFTNALDGANTDWGGSTLYLNSGTAYGINTKTAIEDRYDTLQIGANTDINMWNSSATTTVVDGTGSLYSQDHSALLGDLYIWGDYVRSSGTEYWSYTRDFDGTDISGTPRQVDVRLAANATTTITGGATLDMKGIANATTTVDSISGTYAVVVDGSTIDAQYYQFRFLGMNGLTLTGSTTVTSLSNGDFELAALSDGGSMMTIATTTIDENIEEQIFNVRFATSTGVTSGYNVTVPGTAAANSYWWFRNSTGNYDGEAYDNDPTPSPGEIKWDDSGITISVSGYVYADRATTTAGVACDGATPVVSIKVDGGGTHTGSCSAVDGSYSISGVSFSGDVVFTTYLLAAGGTRGATITQTPSANITDMDVYENHVITRHEDAAALTIADMALYDSDQDANIPFNATDAGTDTLVLEPDTALFVWDSSEFTPGGDIILVSGGSGADQDGTLYLDTNATLTAVDGQSHSIGGSWILDTGATFTSGNSTTTFTATTTGKTITPRSSSFHDLVFNGVGGGWSLGGSTSVTNDLALTAGELSGASSLLVQGGDITGDGTFNMSGGVVTLQGEGDFGGSTNWIFSGLSFGDGTTLATTTKVGTNDIEVGGVLTVNTSHILDASGATWNLSGGGTPFVVNGDFDPGTSTFQYTSSVATAIAATGYNELEFAAVGGTPTYTIESGTLSTLGNITFGNSSTTFTVTADTNDPVLDIAGDVLITASSTFVGSDSGACTVGGSWTNQGTFTSSDGTVTFDSDDTGELITAGGSSFGNIAFNNPTGGWTVAENASSTGNWTLSSVGQFTASSTSVVEVGGTFTNGVGGASTTWTGATLYLNSGTTQSINASSNGADVYNTLQVGASTQVRMWNSTSTTYTIDPLGSLYSQDHDGEDGELYIWGDYRRTTGADYWSYNVDFDGADIASSTRQAKVYLADGATTTISGGSLYINGTSTASTTIDVQDSGNYSVTISGGNINAQYYSFRNLNSLGLRILGSSAVTELSDGDFELSVEGGSLITAAGSALTANPLKTFYRNRFATSTGITSGYNVTVTSGSISSWRFTSYNGNLAGEDHDSDPGGDPGLVVWDDSAADITVAGYVYADESGTVSGVCDDSTQVVRLMVQGAGNRTASCASADGYFSISGVTFVANDTLTLYLDNASGGERAANVSVDPFTNIGNMNLYENRVVIRHEDTNPIEIADIAVYDSDDDTDIPFDAETGGTDTFITEANTKVIIWENKTFVPAGNITLTSGGSGSDYDGTLAIQDGATFSAAGTQSHSIGGSWVASSTATFVPSNSTVTFTSTTSGRTIVTSDSAFNDLVFNGLGGGWTMSDINATTTGDVTITNGTVVLPSGTLTVGGSFDNSGTFTHNSGEVLFTSATTTTTVTAGGSSFYDTTFNGSGGEWTFQDVNATIAHDNTILDGTVVLPSGTLTVGGSFDNSGTFTHNSGEVLFTSATTTTTVTAGGSSFYDTTFNGSGGEWTFQDVNATIAHDVTITDGLVNLPTGITTISGSLINSDRFTHAIGTLFFNAASGGHTVNVGTSTAFNVDFDNVSGGWTVSGSATSTNDWSITNANSFAVSAGSVIEVQGDFTNAVGGGNTTWGAGSTLYINSGTSQTINTKSTGGDDYQNIELGANTHVRMWESQAVVGVTTASSSSLYSQDHAASDGDLYIWGNYARSSGADYWSYATDFDGTALSGVARRQVDVRIADNATTTFSGGTLQVIGDSLLPTTIANQGSGTYAWEISGGTFNASDYQIRNTNTDGLRLSSSPNVTSLDNGDFQLDISGGSMLTIDDTVIDQNPSKIITGVSFATSTGVTSGYNVEMTATSSNSWTFVAHTGNYDGEYYDYDGADDCGSIRWSDSVCLFVNQTHFRWRNDDGGEAVSTDNWFHEDWEKRKMIRLTENSGDDLTDFQVKLVISKELTMQSNFGDLRFTDSSGTTTLDYWVEKYTSSTSTVWVKVPELSANSTADIYMYYDNIGTVSTTGTGSSTFIFFDDFEDNNITEYSGTDASLFETSSSFNYDGSYGLDASTGNEGQRTSNGGIYRTGNLISQGETIRYFQYLDTTYSDEEPCTLFAAQGSGQNYAVCLDVYGTDQVVIAEDVTSNDASGSQLATENVTFGDDVWYEVEIDWLTTDDINVTVYNEDGTFFASTTANDASYSSGGMGFSFWSQHGGWDTFTSRKYISVEPTYTIYEEQGGDGATWKTDEDVSLTNQEIGENVRLRFAIQNSGPSITGQNFRLEYANKGTSPNCLAVPYGDFSAVPTNTAGCGTDAACMKTSIQFTNNASTTQLLSVPESTSFTQGQIVEDPSNETTSYGVTTGNITEVEYNFQLTAYATSTEYCFRVTNGGSVLDNYAQNALLKVKHNPSILEFSLNSEKNITLTENASTTVYATGTVRDLNGCSDISYATTTFYRSLITGGANCVDDPNNCYQVASSSCVFSGCINETIRNFSCSANMQYFADPTDSGATYEGQSWLPFITIADVDGNKDTSTGFGVDVYTLHALGISGGINYGTLSSGSTTESFNPSTTIQNTGNDNVDIQVSGTDMTSVGGSITVNNQVYATSTFTYSSCSICTFLSGVSTDYEVDLAKPTSTSTPITDTLYWGLNVPPSTAGLEHQGINTITAVYD